MDHFQTQRRFLAGLLTMLVSVSSLAEIEEIIVTAQKRSESLQDVPIAVSTFTGDSLRELGVSNASDLVNLTPGFASGSQAGSNKSYFLRGVGTNDVHLTAASAVGQYFDGVTLTSGFHARAALFDMERVEILKGPQNTLFGLNTTGGAVNYISNKPDIGEGTHGSFTLKLGNHEHVGIDAAIGFDITDTLAARVAVQKNSADGAFKSISNGKKYGDDDILAVRAIFLWEPTDLLTVTLNLHALDSENNSTAVRSIGTRSADGSGGLCAQFPLGVIDFEDDNNCLGRNGGDSGEPASDPSTGDWETTAQDLGFEDLKTKGFYVKFDYDYDWATFTSITSLDNLDFENANDNDGSDTLGLHSFQADDRDTFQQELRLISSGEGAFRWIAGIYYLYDDAESYTGLRGARPPFGNGVLIPNVQLDHSKENLGVYLQGEYDFGEDVTFTLGLRWSDEVIKGDYLPSRPNVAGSDTHTNYFADDINALVSAQNPGTPEFDAGGFEIARQISQKLTNEDVGITAKLDWRATENSLIYASYSKGFKGAVLDTRPVYALVPLPNVVSSIEATRLDPESLDAWELGYKSTLFDRRVQFDASAFFYKYENLQQFVTVMGNPRLENAPESEIKGFDANIRYGGDSGFYLQAGISILDSEVTDVANSSFFEGAELASAPELSLSLLASQDFSFANGSGLTLTAGLSHTGEQVKSTATIGNNLVVDQLTVDDYTLVNASATYRFGDNQKYTVSVFGKNLTDEHFCGHVLVNDSNGVLRATTDLRRDISQVALCRVTNASTRTYGVSFSFDI